MRVVREDELWHYGVPGMKWGHHKYVDDEGNLTEHAKKKFASGITGYDAEHQIRNAQESTFKKNQGQYIAARFADNKAQFYKEKGLKKGDESKYQKKIDKYEKQKQKAMDNIAQGENFVNKIIEANNAKGFETKDYLTARQARRTNVGATIADALLWGAIGGFILGTDKDVMPVAQRRTEVVNKDAVDNSAAKNKYARKDSAEVDRKVAKRLEKQKKHYYTLRDKPISN